MRVAWAGTFDPDFPRNEKLARLMEMSGVEVRVISKSLWAGDRIALAARPGPRVVLKALVAYPVLLFRLIVAPSPDVYLVSYPGWFDIPLVRMVASIGEYAYATDGGRALYVNLFVDSDADVEIGDTTVRLRQSTRYPYDGRVALRIELDGRPARGAP